MTDSSAPYAPSVLARFWAKVDKTPDGCWLWTDQLDRYGYGKFTVGHARRATAHRFIYTALHGAVPQGIEIDHLCHGQDSECAGGVTCAHRRCVNPDHLEAVTHRENMLRGNTITAAAARKTHCNNGHPLAGKNLRIEAGGRRRCLACQTAAVLRRRARIRAQAAREA